MLGFEPIVRAYLAWALHSKGRLQKEAIAAVWSILVGRIWAQRTRVVGLAGSRLEVAVPDPVWLQEMRFQSQAILDRLNRMLPDGVPRIKTLRLSMAAGIRWTEPTPARANPPIELAELTEEQTEALEQIADPDLREIIRRVLGRRQGDQGGATPGA